MWIACILFYESTKKKKEEEKDETKDTLQESAIEA